ncbi:leucyl aminopeptidase [Candidatus Uhrbacteria bacterium]|nr:leucyl aminopeptidase [Candidatus Uhrbacteria bacterium]
MKVKIQQGKPAQLLPKVKVQSGRLEKFGCDLLVVKWVQGQKIDGSTGAVDRALRGVLGKMIKAEEFKGKEGEVLVFPTLGKIPAKKIMLLGLGEQKNVTAEGVRKAAARIVKEARRQKAKKVGMVFIGTGTAEIDPFLAAKAITEGALLGAYTYTKYKSAEAQKEMAYPSELSIVTYGVHEKFQGQEKEKIRSTQSGIREGELYARAAIFARELVNEPASNMFPKTLADIARAFAKSSKDIELKILNRAQCEKLGMGAYLGVAKGSDHEPYFLHLVYRPKISGGRTSDPTEVRPHKVKKVAIVGKGITFDSGGLSLKPSQHMETMKLDMAGCAAMLGVFSAITELKPNVEVHGISPVCENMPSGKAQKPGDIVRTISGKTVEVLNTDAEGRLALADAFGYVAKFVKPDAMVDLATLTGACMVALGEEVAGYMGNNPELLEQVKKAAQEAGERVWELPLVEEYREQTKSHVADLSNVTPSRYAGAITAGLFLEEFVDKKLSWVHMDIAGPAFAEKEVIPYHPKGATGFGVRTMLELLKNLSSK